ncbi:MAG: B3/B4 domain-containing protein [Fidelibacterota bacterium]
MKQVTLSLPIRAGVIEVNNLTVSENSDAYQQLIVCGNGYREKYAGMPISEIPGIQNARRLFRALGIEPTKYRPASEAMLRRFLKDKAVYSVNNLVDVSNWCAVDFLLPNGVYDRAKIVGDIELRRGLPDESYPGLNNLELHMEGRYVLADARGPFGSPKTDSQRTCVDLNTTEIITIIYAPEDYDPSILQRQCNTYAQRIVEYCGGVIERSVIIT